MKKFLHIFAFMFFCHYSMTAQTTLLTENFDSYSTSQKLAQQATGSWWTTWSGTPGSSEDAAISTEQAHSVSNSTKIISNNDLVLLLGDKTTGRFQVKFYVYVVTGKLGFIGFMQDFAGSNTVFGLSLSFDGTEGSLNIGGNEFIFNYTPNSWLLVNAIIDLDNDFASLFIDGQEKGSGVWSLGSDGTSTILKLDAIDFWGDASGTGSTYYIDDLEYKELLSVDAPTNLTSIQTDNNVSLSWNAPASGSPTGYAICRNNKIIDYTTLTSYDDNGLYPQNYEYSVRASYGEYGYSAASNVVSHLVDGGVPRKYTVFEVGTGTWCQYCPGAAMGVHDMEEENLNIAVVKYHSGDSYEFAGGESRLSYYDISSFPTSKIDGILTYGGGSQTLSLYSIYKPLYDERIAIPSTHDMTIEVTQVDKTHYTASITVTEEFEYYTDSLLLITTLTESEISETWFNQTQVNNVCRALYPDANGTFLDFSTNTTQTVDFNITLDSGWDADNCELIAFVQNKTSKEIIQAIKFDINLLTVSANIEDESTNVSVINDIVFSFSEPIRFPNNDTIFNADTLISFRVGDVNGTEVAFTTTFNETMDVITVEHDSLDLNTTYYIAISPYLESFNDLSLIEGLEISFTTEVGTAINPVVNKKDINIYPNPASERITMEFNLKENSNIRIEIYNESGQLVQLMNKENLNSGNNIINLDVSKLNSGLYFMNLISKNESVTQKIQIIK